MGLQGRECQGDCCAHIFLTLEGEGGLVIGCSMLYYGEAQAGSTRFAGVTFIHPVEALKDPAVMGLGDTDPSVSHLQHYLVFGPDTAHQYLPPRSVVLDGIVTEIIDEFKQDPGSPWTNPELP